MTTTCLLCGGATVELQLFHPDHLWLTLPVRSCVECARAAVPGVQMLDFARRLKQQAVLVADGRERAG